MSTNPTNIPASLEARFVRQMKLLARKIVEDCRRNASNPLFYPDVLRSFSLDPSFQKCVFGIARDMTTSITSYFNKAWWFRRRRVVLNNRRRGESLLVHVQAVNIFSGLLNEMGMKGMDEFLANKIEENAALLLSVPLDMAEKLSKWASQRTLQVGRAEIVAKEIEEIFPNATMAKFRTIAHTEFSKTKVAVTKFKSVSLKIPAYVWKVRGLGKGDGRTRRSHKGMADVIVFWDDAPAPEDLFPMKTKEGKPYKNILGHYHCGCCPNCLCTPMPLVFMEDLKFPVRVYINGKIIRMNQVDFDKLYRKKSEMFGKNPSNLSDDNQRLSLVFDGMSSEELSKKAKRQKRDDKGRFAKEGDEGQEKNGVSALENKSSNKVNLEFIKSKSYRNKFDRISDNPELNQSVYESAVAILSEKNGTDFESVHVKDIDGNHIGDNTENENRLKCSYGKDLEEKIHELQRENKDFVVIHNHPNNTPPSPKDFYDAFQKGYKFGIIACHDGSVYKYYPPKHIFKLKDVIWCNEIINDMVSLKFPINDAFIYTYIKYKLVFERV